MVERALYWYRDLEERFPQMFSWNILIINEPREIKIIKNNLYNQLKTIDEEKCVGTDLIKNSGGLHYDLSIFISPTTFIEFRKVYEGKVKSDRRLIGRKTSEGWNDLVTQISSGNF